MVSAVDFAQNHKNSEDIKLAICPSCDKGVYPLDSQYKFCGYCGKELSLKCPKETCGQPHYNPKHYYCVNCGTKVRAI